MNAKLTRTTRATLAGALAALTLLGAGCGGGDESTGEQSSGAPTEAEFIAQADHVCTDSAAEIDAEVRSQFGTEPPSERELIAFFGEVTIPALGAQYEEIGALTPPEGQEGQVQAFVDAGEEAVSAAGDDPGSLLVFQGGSTPFDEANRLAQDLGLQVCGGAEEPLNQG